MVSWCFDVLTRAWWRLRLRWARWWRDGAVRVTPRLRRPLTYRRFERACLALSLDPDKVRKGEQDVEAAELGDVYERGPELAELVCRNHRFITQAIRQSERPVAEEILAHVMAAFFLQSLIRFRTQKRSYATMQNGAP